MHYEVAKVTVILNQRRLPLSTCNITNIYIDYRIIKDGYRIFKRVARGWEDGGIKKYKTNKQAKKKISSRIDADMFVSCCFLNFKGFLFFEVKI